MGKTSAIRDEGELLVRRRELELYVNNAFDRYHAKYVAPITPGRMWLLMLLYPFRLVGALLRDFALTMLGLSMAIYRRVRHGTPIVENRIVPGKLGPGFKRGLSVSKQEAEIELFRRLAGAAKRGGQAGRRARAALTGWQKTGEAPE
jgi:hypothetical protein